MNKDAIVSRKWKLVLLILLITTIGTFFPPIISMFLIGKPLIILTGGEFVTLISLVIGLYMGANVYQKKIVLQENTQTNIREGTDEKIEASAAKMVKDDKTAKENEEKAIKANENGEA